MSVTIKCQHSGIEFEAATRRTKQHPYVAAAKKAASKDGRHRELDKALSDVAEDSNYTTIEEYMQQVNERLKGVETIQVKREVARQEYKRRYEAAGRATANRFFVNAKLKQHGYQWFKLPNFVLDTDEWELHAPDGRTVTVDEALAEIEAK